MIDSGVQVITEQIVYQIVPEAYQSMVMWLIGIAISLWAIYNFIRPFIDKWASNRNIAAISENALTPEQITNAVDIAMKAKEKVEAQRELGAWQYKLLHATTQEAKDMCNAEIAKLTAIINA